MCVSISQKRKASIVFKKSGTSLHYGSRQSIALLVGVCSVQAHHLCSLQITTALLKFQNNSSHSMALFVPNSYHGNQTWSCGSCLNLFERNL